MAKEILKTLGNIPQELVFRKNFSDHLLNGCMQEGLEKIKKIKVFQSFFPERSFLH